MEAAVGPLSGIRVLEVGGIGPIPFCGMILSDFGAEVLRIERISSGVPSKATSGDPGGILGRNRKIIGVDLKAAGGVDVVLSLVDHMDVVIEGFRPGVMERLGLGPDVCHTRNSRLIFGRMTGWGQTGPMAQAPGHDMNYISTVGLLGAVGSSGRNPTPPLNVAGDYGGGGMLLALGVCAALYERQMSGKGQVIDAAMCDGAALLMNTTYELMQLGEWSTERESNLMDGGAHFYATYETADGEHVSLAASEPQFYHKLLGELGLAHDQDLSVGQMDRGQWPAFRQRFAAIFKTKTRAAWDRQLLDKGVCYTPVLNFAESQQFPHNLARGTFVKSGAFVQAAPAPRFSRTTLDAPRPGAKMGSHTQSVLTALGLSPARIAELQAAGVIV